MPLVNEKNNSNVLDLVYGTQNSGTAVTAINGQTSLVGQRVALSIGGSIIVQLDGKVLFDSDSAPVLDTVTPSNDSIIIEVEKNGVSTEVSVAISVLGVSIPPNNPPVGNSMVLEYDVESN